MAFDDLRELIPFGGSSYCKTMNPHAFGLVGLFEKCLPHVQLPSLMVYTKRGRITQNEAVRYQKNYRNDRTV